MCDSYTLHSFASRGYHPITHQPPPTRLLCTSPPLEPPIVELATIRRHLKLAPLPLHDKTLSRDYHHVFSPPARLPKVMEAQQLRGQRQRGSKTPRPSSGGGDEDLRPPSSGGDEVLRSLSNGKIKENSRRVKEKARNRENREEMLSTSLKTKAFSPKLKPLPPFLLKRRRLSLKCWLQHISPKREAFFGMKNAVSLKRDLGSLSETSWVYILSASESEVSLEFWEKNASYCRAATGSITQIIILLLFL
ncbi:hypothetical protein DEO72_LG6g914 [Vigna unguiculata]|uniref:Uncharacterized protein n=1 Tax=Vigna unguiculata TaxID=3917 RepID=A0A4D6M4M2_VIGUN|nr:hypothetical protein DEO72_LG6g914 [Vigna unguiculata]